MSCICLKNEKLNVINQVKRFIKKYCKSTQPLLLALSGGADSLSLFYCLLACRLEGILSFHVAHVDHGWREESTKEATILKNLAEQHHVPYHQLKIDLSQLAGNLEDACRKQRQKFFKEICLQNNLQAVCLGHQENDQVETVLKRILEGSHWSHFDGLKERMWHDQVQFLRPLLGIQKDEILAFLKGNQLKAFEDGTNCDERFMRARMRRTIIPDLNRSFGKKIDNSLVYIASEMSELKKYFLGRVSPLLGQIVKGPFGVYLNLANYPSIDLVEIKYLLHLISEQELFFLSRQILQRASEAIEKLEPQLSFEMGTKKIVIDRGHFFILSKKSACKNPNLQISGSSLQYYGKWMIKTNESFYHQNLQASTWLDGWRGYLKTYLPLGKYVLGQASKHAKLLRHHSTINKWWSSHHVPPFLRSFFPVIWQHNEIAHEFLTGLERQNLQEGEKCLQIELSYLT